MSSLEDTSISSSFVMVDTPHSSWIFVPDPKSSADAQLTDASRLRWRTLADAQAASVDAVRQRELQQLLDAQRNMRSRGGSTVSTGTSDASFLSPEATEALRSALEAELASVQRRDREMQASEDAALNIYQQSTSAATPFGIAEVPRRCDCLGASAGIHRSTCSAGQAPLQE
jgi:hypothetical protein